MLLGHKAVKEQKDLKEFVEQLKKQDLEKSEKAIKAADDAEKRSNEYHKYLYSNTKQCLVCFALFLVAQSCLTCCDTKDYSPPGSSVLGISRQEY